MRRSKSAADYAAIAVAPLLIFIMISALAIFLVLLLYNGGFPQRVSWTLLMFTMGAVAIARIAIEQNRAYSLGYAAALGAATFVVMLRFVGAPVFCVFILVIIAVLADVIVRDCTLIDDDVDASGEGLMDAGRLFVKKRLAIENTDEPTKSEQRPAAQPAKRTKHQPGRTVMYLAFAAMPFFGIGQFMIGSSASSWGRAQLLLAIYLFAALGLLVTTSFLGLRRYLRQRGTEMPGDVTVAWLGGGVALIAAILMVAYLLPVPGSTLASIETPAWLESPGDTSASQWGWGNEGADRSDPEAATTTQDQTSDDKNSDDQQSQKQTYRQGAKAGDVGEGLRSDGPTGSRGSGDKNTSDAGESQASESEQQRSGSQSQSETNSEGNRESSESRDGPNQSARDQSSESKKQQQSGEQQSGDQQSGDQQSGDQQSGDLQASDPQASGQQPGDDSQATTQPERQQATQQNDTRSQTPPDPGSNNNRSSRALEWLGDGMVGIGTLIKWIITLGLAAVVAWFVRTNWQRLVQWIRGLLNQDSVEPETILPSDLVEPTTPPRPFSSYRNPIGREQDLRKVVVITFQAFEAWAREQGAVRRQDETPSEFLRRARSLLPSLAQSHADLVGSYNRIVYGRGQATERDAKTADQVWQSMR